MFNIRKKFATSFLKKDEDPNIIVFKNTTKFKYIDFFFLS